MSEYCVYVPMEAYLAQWYRHECGGTDPVVPPRGSIEGIHLEVFLQRLPNGEQPHMCREGEVAVALPYSKVKDPRVYNHLSRPAINAFVQIVRNRFDLALWNALNRFGYIGRRQADLIYAWMEANGIENTETNWNAIAKRYQRKRKMYLDSQYRLENRAYPKRKRKK